MTPAESIAWHPGHPGGSTDILPYFADVLPTLPKGGTYVEVGCFFGRSISFVGLTRPDLTLVAVDPWTEEWTDAGETLPVGPDRERRDKYGGMFEAFKGTLQEHAPGVFERLRIIREPSQTGLAKIADASVDLAFLDGDHTQAGLAADIEHAKRIVKPGGIIAGHDFCWQDNGVCRAVKDAFLFKVGSKGYNLAPWPEPREGWEPGHSSVWWVRAT